MSEQKILKKQLLTHMVYNLMAFALIFSIFGFIVAFMFKYITYSSIDNELIKISQLYLEDEKNRETISDYFFKDRDLYFERFSKEFQDIRDYNLATKVSDPKYTVIVRDEKTNIINNNDLGRYYEKYGTYITFDKNNLEEVYTLNFGENFHYRGINLKLDSNQYDERYIQILLNADSEVLLVNRFGELVAVSVVIGILLSIVASYILSKKTLIPIAETINKQTEFVQNASHELRTPLTIIQAKQELLLREPNSKIIDKSEDIVLTLNETKRLAKLTKDLMTLASAYSNEIQLDKEYVDIDELIKNTLKPYIEVAKLSEKEMNLNLKYGKKVDIDVNKIEQLLIILLDNALKYTENGDRIEVATFTKDGKCNIEVRDTGIGISDRGLKEVFNRFYREDSARNRETGGSGLGLSIAHTIIKAHNGTIKAVHNMPKGTVFIIKLPKV